MSAEQENAVLRSRVKSFIGIMRAMAAQQIVVDASTINQELRVLEDMVKQTPAQVVGRPKLRAV